MEQPAPELVSTTDAAASVGVSGRTLRQWAREKRVTPTAWTSGGHARWDPSDLRRQLEELHPARA